MRIDLVLVGCLVRGGGRGGGIGEGVESCGLVAEVMGVWIGKFEGVIGEEVVIIGDGGVFGVLEVECGWLNIVGIVVCFEENCNGEVKGSVWEMGVVVECKGKMCSSKVTLLVLIVLAGSLVNYAFGLKKGIEGSI
nr:hypothetical protein [Tanacetum cinerariifolium]